MNIFQTAYDNTSRTCTSIITDISMFYFTNLIAE
jgi:hypothetical protein